MTRGARIAIGGLLLAATVALLGYTVYTVRERIAALESTVEFYESERAKTDAFQKERLALLYAAILEPAYQARLQAIVTLEDEAARRDGMDAVFEGLFGRAGPYQVPGRYGFDNPLLWRLSDLVEGETEDQRAAVLEGLNAAARGDDVVLPIIEPEVVGGLAWLGQVSTLVTALGGLGSGILSFMVFFRGGGTRRLEDEMLALDIELKRIEVAKARFAAREVLATGTGD